MTTIPVAVVVNEASGDDDYIALSPEMATAVLIKTIEKVEDLVAQSRSLDHHSTSAILDELKLRGVERFAGIHTVDMIRELVRRGDLMPVQERRVVKQGAKRSLEELRGNGEGVSRYDLRSGSGKRYKLRK